MLHFTRHVDLETGKEWLETNLKGKSLLSHPLLNKGTAYSREERDQLGLIGKLPYEIENLEQQVGRARYQYKRYDDVLQKHIYLNNLHDKNEVLFYKLCSDDIDDIFPMIYTPGVGSAVKAFSQEFRQPRGLYLSYPDRNKMEMMLDNRTHPEINLFVVTDGEGVLGIGDQGIGGIDIPIAKLIVYSLCGVDPYHTLPIMLDVGTDNDLLLNDPMYLGWRHKRIRGKEYDDFIDSFVQLVKRKFPQSFLHWEDFGCLNARRIQEKYDTQYCTFNDDMQGTGVVTRAALLSAIEATDIPLNKHKIIIFGAGTAGVGIADQLLEALERLGIEKSKALKQFWLVDRQGLLMIDAELKDFQKPYARTQEDIAAWTHKTLDLLSVVKEVEPTILVGCSTSSGAFTEEIVQAMAHKTARPIIFPLSNPTEKCEAHPKDLIEWTHGKALVATGGPIPPVVWHDLVFEIPQCNNAFSFPGIGLGVLASKAERLTDNMLWAASLAICERAPIKQDKNQPLLPPVTEVRNIAHHVAEKVVEQAIKDGVARVPLASPQDLVKNILWEPFYRTIKPAR